MHIKELGTIQINAGKAYALGLIYPLLKNKILDGKEYLLGPINHNSGMVEQAELAEHYNTVYRLFKSCEIHNKLIIKTNKSAEYSLTGKLGFSVLLEITDTPIEECLDILTKEVLKIRDANDEVKKSFIRGCFDGRSSWDKTAHYLAVDVDRDYKKQDLIDEIMASLGLSININRREKNHSKNDQIRIKPDCIQKFITDIGMYSCCRERQLRAWISKNW